MRELAVALSAIERGEAGPAARPRPPSAVVGVVGAPGVGKSSVIESLVERSRRRGESVVVLAVDPSSPVTGGAVLGDRIRMARHDNDPGAFIRSFASRGHPGGLAAAIPAAVDAALALGWDRVFVEPVGGGQSDVDIVASADTVLLLLSPESGDDVQMLKAGILELAQVVAVNKADRPGAERLAGVLGALWTPPPGGAVILLSALEDRGIDELDAALLQHSAAPRPVHDESGAVDALLGDLIALARRALADPATRRDLITLLGDGRRADAVQRAAETMRRRES